MEILTIILAVAVIALAVLLFMKNGKKDDALRSDAESVALQQLRADYAAQMEKISALHRSEMEMREKFFNDQRARDTAAWSRQLEAVNAQAEARFKELSAKLLQQSASELGRSNLQQLGTILTPLQQRIEDFRKAVADAAVEDKASRSSFRDKIDELMRLNVTLGEEAERLTRALRSESKTQGDWGEMTLRTLLEQGGLVAGIHFTEQLTTDASGGALRDKDGRGLRPDFVVNIPDNRRLVIDSKVSLKAYLDLNAAETSESRKEASERLVKSVRKHIDELADKKYQDYIESSPDFVMMFIPVEGAYMAALQADPQIWRYAYDRRVSLSSPTHLFAVIRMVTSMWDQDNRNRNALAIADKASGLQDKLVLFMESFVEVGKYLDSARASYDKTVSRATSGKGNLLRMSRELEALGAKGKNTRSIPQKLICAEGEASGEGPGVTV